MINRVPSKSIPKTPFELWTVHKLSLRYIRIWGCQAHVKKAKIDKLESRTELCLFVGYPKERKMVTFIVQKITKCLYRQMLDFLRMTILEITN